MLVADAEQVSATGSRSTQKSRRVISSPEELALQPPLLTDERCHADRDKEVRDFDTELGNVPGRWLSREPGRVFVVHAGEVGGIGQKNADLDDVFQRCAGRFQDRLAVGKCLPCLLLNRGADEVLWWSGRYRPGPRWRNVAPLSPPGYTAANLGRLGC